MSPEASALLAPSAPGLEPVVLALVVSTIYLRGARRSRHLGLRAVAFFAGLAALGLALLSPLDALGGFLLSAHMTQHLLLLAVAPPLFVVGRATPVLLRGLPALARFAAWPPLVRLGRALEHPLVGLGALSLATWVWHVPALYERALANPLLHVLEHGTFFGAALLFWSPLLHRRRRGWTAVLLLLAADVQNTALAALLGLSDHVVYPSYARVPRLFGLSALDDQTLAAMLMWVPGSLLYLGPAVALSLALLAPAKLVAPGVRPAPPPRVMVGRARLDLLLVPRLGVILRARATRVVAQTLVALVAVAVIVDGLRGSPAAGANLAGVVPWIWGRALVVAGLLAAGNLFCFACPFTLPRALARRFRPRRGWPRSLRSKWVAAAVVAIAFVALETVDAWDRPRVTAAIALGYFVVVFAVDALFTGASFCKWLCPIGQFQFVHSLVSPLEVRVREPDVCARCATHDCLRGNANSPGCALALYLPRKEGNLDCTFCLDCARACPHDNVGLVAVIPAATLLRDPRRSSLGRLSRRPDLAALALVLVGGSLATAAIMTLPVAALAEQLGHRLRAPGLATAFLFVALLAAPGALAFVAVRGSAFRCRLALALVPLGLAMFAAHFSFHLWMSVGGCSPEIADASLRWQLLILDGGLLLSLALGWRIAEQERGRPLALLWPWALVAVALWSSGVWIFLQPMQMRGMAS